MRWRGRAAWIWTLAACTAAVASGCGFSDDGRREVAKRLRSHDQARRQLAAGFGRTPRVTSPPPAASPQQGAAPSSLSRLIELALERNQGLRAARERAAAAAERVPQRTALPDPTIKSTWWTTPVRTAEGDNDFNVAVSQKLPLPQRLASAGRVEIEATRMALADVEALRLRVIADVKRAWFRLYVIDRSAAITLDNQGLLQGLIEAARAQVAAGGRSQGDVLRAQVELSNLEADLIQFAQQRETVAAQLNALLDRPVRTPVASPPILGIRQTTLKLAPAIERALAANPELAGLRHQIDRDTEAVGLAKLGYWPDFELGFQWMQLSSRAGSGAMGRLSDDGSDNFAVHFGFSVPLWTGRIDAAVAEKEGLLRASRRQLDNARNRVAAQLDDALERLRSRVVLATLFDDTIIPQAQQTYEVSRASYASGTSDFLDVIDNWRKWLTFTIQYHRLLGEVETSAADLEQAAGLSLEALGEHRD